MKQAGGRRRRVLEYLFLSLGLLVSFFGWFLDHAEAFGWVRRTFSPRYDQALGAYRVLAGGGAIASTDSGFRELIDAMGAVTAAPIVRVEALAPIAALTSQGLQQGRSLRFELQDGRIVEKAVDFGWLELRISEKYLDRPTIAWSQGFMLLGLAITFGAGLSAILREGAQGKVQG